MSPSPDNDRMLDSLTNQETAVLGLLARDLSNQEIADRLFLSVSTVKWYVRQLNSKLDTTNREEIVQRAYSLGLLQDASQTTPAVHNLPQHPTPFVGRRSELADVQRLLLQEDVRLLTILAPGGMGKTRLAVQASDALAVRFADGVHYVDLSSLYKDELTTASMPAVKINGATSKADYAAGMMIDAIARSLGYQYQPGERSQTQQVLDFLAGNEKLLLLDSFEPLMEGAGLITELLQHAPRLKVLVTSRERLNLLNEHVYVLSGLNLPDWARREDALTADSVQLFVQAAQRLQPAFEVTEENWQSVVEICQLTEGMPLGLLLSAAWLDALPLGEIAAEIQKSLDFLEAEMRDLPRRQRSVRAVFEASWKRLTAEDRDAFARLSVFQGGFTREAAQAVAEASLVTLRRLVSKALVTQSVTGRYRIHDLLRQYAARKLADSTLGLEVLQAHTLYFAEFGAQCADQLFGEDLATAIHALDLELQNLRAVWVQASALRMSAALGKLAKLWLYYDMRGLWQELVDVSTMALRELGDMQSTLAGELLTVASIGAYRRGSYEEARDCCQRAQTIFDATGATEFSVLVRMNLANIYVEIARIDEAVSLLEALTAEAQALKIAWLERNCYVNWGYAMLYQGKLDEAERLFVIALDKSRAANDLISKVVVLHNLGEIAYRRADTVSAKRLLEESLAISTDIDNVLATYVNLATLGKLALLHADYQAARTYALRAGEVDHRSGLRQIEHLGLLALATTLRGDLAEARTHLLTLIGRLMGQAAFDYLPTVLESLPQFLHAAGYREPAAQWIDRFLSMGVPDARPLERLTMLAEAVGRTPYPEPLEEHYAQTLRLLQSYNA
ncbi:MAG TPA: LuxR C-terminal-related transcriptional regulator [Aggregatilineales bacterium]|nr:LuxR C-terminal-related transcriptional regulator [Aggregatilineales bacterium]